MDLEASKEDVLKEIGNMGAGNASKALSKMTGQKIEVGFPTVEIKKLGTIPEIIEDKSENMVSVWLNVGVEESGDEKDMGRMMLIMNKSSAKNLASFLNGQEVEDLELNEMDESALKETGNILSGSALTAITSFLDMKLVEGIPNLEIEPLQDLMDDIILEISDKEGEALVFRTRFSFEEEVTAYFLFVFRAGGQAVILERLNV